jgi:hypothetical protein
MNDIDHVFFRRPGAIVRRLSPRQTAKDQDKRALPHLITVYLRGITRLRLVQSGFGPQAAWMTNSRAPKKGWADFLKKLKEVLEQE